MNPMYDVVILGCGEAGIFAAYELARLHPDLKITALDQGREGIWNRLYDASRVAASLPELLAAAKTKRYAMARLRRMVLWAYLGLTPAICRSGCPICGCWRPMGPVADCSPGCGRRQPCRC